MFALNFKMGYSKQETKKTRCWDMRKFWNVLSQIERNAQSQKQALLNLRTSWLGDLQDQDDITIVVVKKTIALD